MSSTDPQQPSQSAPAGDAQPSHGVDGPLAATPRVRDEGRTVRDGARALVFKPSRLTIFAILVATVGSTPLMFSVPWFWLLLVVPIAAIAWILRIRTTVDPETITVRTVTGSRTVDWDAVRGLRIGTRSRVGAVLDDDSQLDLPAVHVRDLPALALASGGRITDPVAEQDG